MVNAVLIVLIGLVISGAITFAVMLSRRSKPSPPPLDYGQREDDRAS